MISKIRALRFIGIAEGISFLVLLGIAMPLKYFYGIPEVVKYVGWAHGFLFMLYIPAVFVASRAMGWNFLWVLIALATSLFPLGTFMLDRLLVRRERELLSPVNS
jgi:integral membrane protein